MLLDAAASVLFPIEELKEQETRATKKISNKAAAAKLLYKVWRRTGRAES